MAIYSRISIAEFTKLVGNNLESLLTRKNEITLAVPGGTTPKNYLEAISRLDLDWDRVHIFLTDERWVDNTSAESNELLVRRHLLQNRAARARLHGVYQDGLSPALGAKIYAEKLGNISVNPDIVILGMGKDTHVASIFPDNEKIFILKDLYAAVTENSILLSSRVTLTPAAILNSSVVILAIAGEDKVNALTSAWNTNDMIKTPALIMKNRPAETSLICSLQALHD